MKRSVFWLAFVSVAFTAIGYSQEKQPRRRAAQAAEPTYPPQLPGAKEIVTDTSDEFLKSTGTLADGVVIAKTPPTIDFLYYPGQDYPGKPWSNWGDSSFSAVNDKYYSAIGDHLAPQGNAFVYEYDPRKKSLRRILDLKKLLNLPEGHYMPGKIHTRTEMGRDGWVYCATHRGSTTVTTDKYHYQGDWIVRCHPETGKSEVVVRAPVSKHCIPNGTLDPQRLIFYGGTAPGDKGENEGVMFFAYDVEQKKLLYSGPHGPQRYMILSSSTGRVYYTPGMANEPLMRYDAASGGSPEKIAGKIGIRAATRECADGNVYTVSQGRAGNEATLYRFNTKTEEVQELGPAAVGAQGYIAAMTAEPSGRYVYYVPGAHGSGDRDGSPVVQFDTKLKQRKVIAFLNPFYQNKYGCTPKGTYAVAVDDKGETLYVTWNVSRGSRAWDCCALTAIHIPESERAK